jgi:hypothetical protein
MKDKIKFLSYLFNEFDSWKTTFSIMEKIISIEFYAKDKAFFTYKTIHSPIFSANIINL